MEQFKITILDNDCLFLKAINKHFENINLIKSIDDVNFFKTDLLIVNSDLINSRLTIKKSNYFGKYNIFLFLTKNKYESCLMNFIPYNNMLAFKTIVKDDNFFDIRIYKLLSNIGLPNNLKGYYYIKGALLKMIKENISIKDLYLQLALEYNTTSSNIERAIRHAIEISWSRANINFINKIFGQSLSKHKDRPTNSEFIYTLTEFIRVFD